MSFPKATDMAHELVAKRIRKRSCVIDATAGNGHDTVFLAEKVGPTGKVFAFDIQEPALDATRARLEEAGHSTQVSLKNESHEHLGDHLPKRHHGHVQAIMFNLGYLPGGDKSVTTRWVSTMAALRASLDLISESGIITVTAYPGHLEGGEEANAIVQFGRWLDPREYRVLQYHFLNLTNDPPFLVAIERAG
jgi:SAM-dependent methyltransferase